MPIHGFQPRAAAGVASRIPPPSASAARPAQGQWSPQPPSLVPRALALRRARCWTTATAASACGSPRLADPDHGGRAALVHGLRQATAAFVGPAAGHFRFLFGPDDFQYGVGGRPYTLADGENGVTLAGCPPTGPGQPQRHARLHGVPRPPTRITFLVGY
jgi:hypothetical protein